MPEISIIVPVYKVEKYLCRCVDSILAQTFEDFELVLVNDGSPDNCGKICDLYSRVDERVKVIHKKNGGVSSARNAGLDYATGKYISFVDSDDVIHPRYYEIMWNGIGEGDLIFCKFQKIDEKKEFKPIYLEEIQITKLSIKDAKKPCYHFLRFVIS